MVFNIIKQRHPEFLDVAKLIFQGHRHGSDGLLLRFREALEKRRLLLVQRMTRLQECGFNLSYFLFAFRPLFKLRFNGNEAFKQIVNIVFIL